MSGLLDILYYIVPFIILLGVLVFVHEFGHFIIARLLKVKVVAFSIGFGKELWSHIDKRGTRWKVSAIPLGGYCQFLGDADASSSTVDNSLETLSEEDKKGAFPLQPSWKKIAIVVAGPLFNYLFAVMVFFSLFFFFGRMIYPSVVGAVMQGEAADMAGIKVDDKIISINGKNTPDFQSLSNEVSLSETDVVEVALERPMTIIVKPQEVYIDKRVKKKILGIGSFANQYDEETHEKLPAPAIVAKVVPESAAQKAGIMIGDAIDEINDTIIQNFDELQAYVRKHANEELTIKLRRPMILSVTLKDTEYDDENGRKIKRRMLGIRSKPELTIAETMGFAEAIYASFEETYSLTATTLRGLGQMITGKRGGKDVGGIIRIAEMSGDISKTGGLLSFIYFMALLSVNLGLINLLPIPVLDGGSLVIFVIEWITGHELKEKARDLIFKIGLLIILAIMVLATWNDVVHLVSRWFD